MFVPSEPKHVDHDFFFILITCIIEYGAVYQHSSLHNMLVHRFCHTFHDLPLTN
jgi:hypothetical protein